MLGDDMCRFPGLQDKTKQIKNRAKALKYVGQKAALKTGLSESDPMDFKTIFRKALRYIRQMVERKIKYASVRKYCTE
jgi:hypothetical protein